MLYNNNVECYQNLYNREECILALQNANEHTQDEATSACTVGCILLLLLVLFVKLFIRVLLLDVENLLDLKMITGAFVLFDV